MSAASLDAPLEPEGEISLLAFDYDATPVEAWRYDACVAEGVCPARTIRQPAADGEDEPAVGMVWEDAHAFCVARGMRAQSPPQDFAIRQSGGRALGPARIDASRSRTHVVSGFRCTRESR